MNLYDRILLALYSLIVIFLLGAAGLVVIGWQTPLEYFQGALNASDQRIFLGIGIAVLILVSLKFFIESVFSNRQPVLAVVRDTELGQVRISVDALENMVLRVTGQIKGIGEVKPRVECLPEGADIMIRVTLQPETGIPQISADIQNQVSNYITNVAGIKVKSIKVIVDGVSSEKQQTLARRLN